MNTTQEAITKRGDIWLINEQGASRKIRTPKGIKRIVDVNQFIFNEAERLVA